MGAISITPLYAAVLALFFIALSIRTIGLRRKHKIGIGDSGNIEMLRAMRVHANFAEYTPLALLLLAFVEMRVHTNLAIHGLCILLLLGRVLHALGVSRAKENFRFRVSGMLMTFTVIIIASVWLVGLSMLDFIKT